MVAVQETDPIKRTFKTASGTYEIPVNRVEDFLKDFPDAQELKSFKVGEAQYDIPMGEEAAFLKDFPDAKPLYQTTTQLPSSKTEIDAVAELLPWVEVRKRQIEKGLPKFNSQQEADAYLAKVNEQFKQEQADKLNSLFKKYQPQYPTTSEPPGQPKMEERSIFGIIPFIGNAIHYGGKAVERGFFQGQTADIINPYADELTTEDAARVAEYQKSIASRPQSEEYKQFTQAESIGDALAAFASRPLTVMAELLGESMTALAIHGAPRIAGGAAMGAGVGATGLGVGAAPGAATGALAAVPDVSLNLEYSGKILESLSEMGVDTTDGEAIILAFSDPDKVDQLREIALKKAVPIAAFDALSAGLAGKFYSAAVKRGGSKVIAGLKELGTQMATGGLGEIAGEISAGEKLKPGSILAEMIGEIGGGTVESAIGAQQKAKIINEEAAKIAEQLPPEVVAAQNQVLNEVQTVAPEEVTPEKPRIRIQGELGENTETIPEGDDLKANLQQAIQKLDNARIAALPTGRLSVPRTKVTVDEMGALKDVIRREAAAARGGAKVVKEAVRDITSQITETLDGLRLPAKKVTTIINRIGRVNLLNPIQVARLEKYVEKVAEDQVYADKIQQAEILQQSLKNNIGKFTAQQQEAVKQLANIKVDDVSDLDEFITVANKASAATKRVEGDNYAPMETREVTDYLDREIPKITQFIESNMEPLPTDEELKGPSVSVKLGQMAIDRVERLKAAFPKGKLLIIDRMLEDLKEIDLSQKSPVEMRELIRTIDNILVNEDYGGAGQVAAINFQNQNSSKIPKISEKLFKVAKSLADIEQYPVWINQIFGGDKAAAQFQAYSNINRVFGQNAVVEKKVEDLVKVWEKLVPKRAFNHDQHVLLSQFAELMQYTTTPQEGFDAAKANIEKDIENKKTGDYPDLAVDVEQWGKLSKFTNPAELEAYFKKSHPELYKQWKFLVDEFAKIEPDLAANSEALYGEKLEKVNNYIPFRTITLEGTQEALEDIGAVDKMLQTQYAVKPKAAPTTISRVKVLPDNRIRDRRLLSVVLDRYKKSLYDIHVSYEVLRAGKTLNAAKDVLGKAGVIEAFNQVITRQRGKPPISNPIERFAVDALDEVQQLAYGVGLGGILPGVLQAGSAMTSTMTDLATSGKNPFLFFTLNKGSEKVRNQYSIGRRLSHMGGLSEIKNANLRVSASLGKIQRNLAQKYNWFKEKALAISLASQVYLDFVPAKQAWNAHYLSKLQELGVDISNIDWEQEAKRQNEETRRLAAAHAEQKTDVLLSSSAVEKRAKVLTSDNVAAKTIKLLAFPFPGYMLNFKTRIANAAMKVSMGSGKEKAAGVRELSVLMAEAAMVSMMIRPLIQDGQGGITAIIREFFGYPEDEEDKERRDELRDKLAFQNFVKDIMPWALNGAIGDATLDLMNRYYYERFADTDLTYKQWKKEMKESDEELPFVTFEQSPMQEMGMFGMVVEQISGVKELSEVYLRDEDTLVVKDRYGNEVEVDLDERTKRILMVNGFLAGLSFFGVNLRELKTSTKQMRNQIIKENK